MFITYFKNVTLYFLYIIIIIIIGVPTIKAQNYENQMLAGIDFGSKSAKLTIVHQKNGRFTALLDSSIITNITDFTPDVIAKGIETIKVLYDIAAMEYNVQRSNIYVVLSSGVVNTAAATKNLKVIDNIKKTIETDISDLVNKVQAISGPEESMYTFLGQVPKWQQRGACSLNIGGGNTMLGNLVENNALAYKSFFYNLGTKNLTKLTGNSYDSIKLLGDYVTKLEEITPNKISSFYKAEDFASTGFKSKDEVIINGGICWALTNFLYPNAIDDAEVVIKIEDLNNFLTEMANSKSIKKGKLKAKVKTSKVTKEKLVRINKLLVDVGKVYDEKNLLAGAVYLKIVLTQLNKINPKARIVFARDSNNAWIKGFLMYGSRGKKNMVNLVI